MAVLFPNRAQRFILNKAHRSAMSRSSANTGAVTKGRPQKDVDKDQVEYLRTLRFTLGEISSLLGTSLSTIQRRAKEWNIGQP